MTLIVTNFGNLGIKKFSCIYLPSKKITPYLLRDHSNILSENATCIVVVNKWMS